MSLIYFHRFLIICAILFAIYFAVDAFHDWESSNGEPGHMVVAVVSALVAVALALYLRTVRLRKREDVETEDRGGGEG